jgi:membrane protein
MNAAWSLLRKTVSEFFADGCPSQAAALSYYTVFSLPPLLLIVVSVAGSIWGDAAVQRRVDNQVRELVGPGAARQIGAILSAVQSSEGRRGLAQALGIIALVFAATTAFAQLQAALNQAWNVKPSPDRSEVRHFVVKRLVSFGMILAIAFLTLVSLLLSALLAAFSEVINDLLPSGLSAAVLRSTSTLIEFTIFAGLFAAMYKVLPDVVLRWHDAMLGGCVTALLFTGGKFAIGVYLGNTDLTDVYGAAGSLAVILVWTYYSSMILLLGAEFTQVWSQRHGRRVRPERGAVRVKKQEVRVG